MEDDLARIEAIGLALLAMAKGAGANVAPMSRQAGVRFLTRLIEREGPHAEAYIERVCGDLDAATPDGDVWSARVWSAVSTGFEALLTNEAATNTLDELSAASAHGRRDDSAIDVIAAKIARSDNAADGGADTVVAAARALIASIVKPARKASAETAVTADNDCEASLPDAAVRRDATLDATPPPHPLLADLSPGLASAIAAGFHEASGKGLDGANRTGAAMWFAATAAEIVSELSRRLTVIAEHLALSEPERTRLQLALTTGALDDLDRLLRQHETVTVRHMQSDMEHARALSGIASDMRQQRGAVQMLAGSFSTALRHAQLAMRHVHRGDDAGRVRLLTAEARYRLGRACVSGDLDASDGAFAALKSAAALVRAQEITSTSAAIDLRAAEVLLFRGRSQDRVDDLETAITAARAASSDPDTRHIAEAMAARAHLEITLRTHDAERAATAGQLFESLSAHPAIGAVGQIGTQLAFAAVALIADDMTALATADGELERTSAALDAWCASPVAAAAWPHLAADVAIARARIGAQCALKRNGDRDGSADLAQTGRRIDDALTMYSADISPVARALLQADFAAVLQRHAALRADDALGSTSATLATHAAQTLVAYGHPVGAQITCPTAPPSLAPGVSA
ncbi:MAG: hypothetical protein AAFR55_04090 [Pseudomonadota bacterium]